MGTDRRRALAAAARRQDIRVAEDDTWTDIFSACCWSASSRTRMGRATVLDEYPTCEAPWPPDRARSARCRALRALRLRVEIANAFGELTDRPSSVRRFEAEMAEAARARRALSVDEDFLSALAAMPPASGIGARFDGSPCRRPARNASSRCCGQRWRNELRHGRTCSGHHDLL